MLLGRGVQRRALAKHDVAGQLDDRGEQQRVLELRFGVVLKDLVNPGGVAHAVEYEPRHHRQRALG
jgi:hypothetical protein